MGHNFGVQPLGGYWLVGMWLLAAAWVTLALAALVHRGTDSGLRLTVWDDRIRYALIPVLLGVAGYSLLTGTPLTAQWYAAKMMIYACMLIIGLILRYVMRQWTTTFRRLASGPDPALESRLQQEIWFARRLAYVYWIGIGTTAFIGVTKFF